MLWKPDLTVKKEISLGYIINGHPAINIFALYFPEF